MKTIEKLLAIVVIIVFFCLLLFAGMKSIQKNKQHASAHQQTKVQLESGCSCCHKHG